MGSVVCDFRPHASVARSRCATTPCLLRGPGCPAATRPWIGSTPAACLFCSQGILVFVAPTRPLVAQQVDACHSFMGMSRTGFCELTGAAAGRWVGPAGPAGAI
jgi:hypothetical protein